METTRLALVLVLGFGKYLLCSVGRVYFTSSSSLLSLTKTSKFAAVVIPQAHFDDETPVSGLQSMQGLNRHTLE